MAIRVPTPNVSLVDLVIDVKEDVTIEEVNTVFKQASENELKDIIDYSDEPLVSIDYTTTDYSAVIDGLSTMVMDDRKIKVIAWYDNRSEEHTSELQSRGHLVCRLLLEKKKALDDES